MSQVLMRKRLSPEWFLRVFLLVCLAGVVWSVWSRVEAQEAAAPAPAAAPVPGLPMVAAEELARNLLGRDFVDAYRGQLSFGLDRVPFLQTPVLGTPLWQYIAFLLYALIAFYASKAVDWLVKNRLRTLAGKTATRWDDVLVGLADGPVKVIVFVLCLNIGLELFDWPDWAERGLNRITLIAVAASLILVLLKSVDAVVSIWSGRISADADRGFHAGFLGLIGRLLKFTIVILAVLTLLQNLGVDITTLLGSVSVLGLALGLAAQDTVANLFGAVAVFLDRPFRLGDRIQAGGVDGFVEEMGLRATRVRTLEGFIVTLPNKTVGNNTVINITRRGTIRFNHAVGITYDTPAPKVRRALELLESIYRGHPQTADVLVRFNKFGDFFLNLDILYWCKSTDWAEATRALQELNLETKERFDAEGIDFAFPTQTIHLKDGGDGGRDVGGQVPAAGGGAGVEGVGSDVDGNRPSTR